MTRKALHAHRAAPRWRLVALAAAAAACAPTVRAQEPPAPAAAAEPQATHRSWAFTPSVSVEQTFTDNYKITSNGESDAITRATVGLHLVGNGSRVRGYFDYSLSGVAYARHSSENEFQNALRANGTIEAIEDFAFIDVNGSVSQQQISAFGPTSPTDALANGNRTEVRTVTVSPYIRGVLGGFARYEVRLTETVNRSSQFGQADYDTTAGSVSLYGGDTRRALGWSLSATTTTQDYTDGASTHNDVLRGTVAYPVYDSVVLTAIGGTERNDLRTAEKKSYSIYGLQLDWVPSQRTNLSARYEHRFFGNAHSVSFTYRMPRTVLTLLDSRDVSVGGRNGFGGTLYDFVALFYSGITDPVQRDLLIQRALIGRDPNSTSIPGFLTTAQTLQRLQSASLGWTGVRDNVVLQLTRTTTQQLPQASTPSAGDLAFGTVRQTGLSLLWSHRLTPLSSLNASIGWTRGSSDNATLSNRLKTLNLGWTTQLAPRLRAGLGARYTNSSGSTAGYTERAVFANLGYQF